MRQNLEDDLSGSAIRPYHAENRTSFRRIAVLGAGAWGTALALAFARTGAVVKLWGRNHAHMHRVAKTRRNEKYISGTCLPQNIRPTGDIKAAVSSADAVFVVTPSSSIKEISTLIREHVQEGAPVVCCSKGLEPESSSLLCTFLQKQIPQSPAMFLSGPSFASEVAAGVPTCVTIAGHAKLADAIARDLSSPSMQLESEADLIGAQVGGLLKNVIAIACGVSDGFKTGSNTRAALISKGLQEAGILAEKLGGAAVTLLGVSGVGDFALTCTDRQSRNYMLGLSLADSSVDLSSRTFEGAATVKNASNLFRKYQIKANICFAVEDMLDGKIASHELVRCALWETHPAHEQQAIA